MQSEYKQQPQQRQGADIIDRLLTGWHDALHEAGITQRRLADQLARELRASKTSRVKVQGTVRLPAGDSGRVRVAAEGEGLNGEVVETVLEFKEDLWSVQQQARVDAQKLFDLYPVERKQLEIDHQVTVLIQRFGENELQEGEIKQIEPKQVN
jgi:hypothetical protein